MAYKLTDGETIELATFLRTLCRMNMLEDAKRVAKMHDGHLSILIQSERLWETVDGSGARGVVQEAEPEKSQTTSPRPPIDFSRPSSATSMGVDKKL